MQGLLFTQDFLSEGITETTVWRSLDEKAFDTFRSQLAEIFSRFPIDREPNEATTERNLIDPVLRLLGWDPFLLQQATGKARRDVPDYLLFGDEESFKAANRERKDERRYAHGIAILEAKRWQRYLDRGREPDLFEDGIPSTQMLRYLSRAEIASERKIQWGILTNGRHWRLYFQGARSRSEEFLEIDLPMAADIAGIERDLFSPSPGESAHHLKLFLVLFRRVAFLPSEEGNRSFHQLALDEGRHWEARVAESLSGVVFDTVFPRLVRALAANDDERPNPITSAYLEEVRVAALTLLYRLLFLFYAEDRNLLPVRDNRYDDYALRRIRDDLRRRIDQRDPLSKSQGRYHQALKALFLAIHGGDESLGLPPYNGGLFDPETHAVLDRVTIPDADFAEIVDRLSRREEAGTRKWINYRDLSVQQLGSIYERLLEFVAVADANGEIAIKPNAFARKTSGSYYTHDDLVGLIIARTVGPLLEERRKTFADKAVELKSGRGRRAERVTELVRHDPATAFLELRICDPAMGSGHFLVSLVDYLADNILEAIAEAEATVDWADADCRYRSPLVQRIEDIRRRILGLADAAHWAIDREQLDDRHIIRRMILKRMIYGVDKNPMAVELAKVALWLHTFTVGAPLSFLDHHLRCGDSLFGEWVAPVMRELSERYALLINPYVQQARQASVGMERIETLTDADIAEVRDSSSAFEGVREATGPLQRFLDFRYALRWLGYHDLRRRDLPQELVAILDGSFGDPFRVVSGEISLLEDAEQSGDTPDMFGIGEPKQLDLPPTRLVEREIRRAGDLLLRRTRVICERERFLHWQIAFPGVWRNWESVEPQGGFDAVIGNPPWDRIKLQEVEWFEARRPEIARATHASQRERMIQALKANGDPLWNDYLAAKEQAEAMATSARQSTDYPLMSRGDINLYALFVERAHGLIESRGIVGLLVPSGIASDLSTSGFFRSITTNDHLCALFDFRNKQSNGELYFPDVYYRFKFAVFVAGGSARKFAQAMCAFHLLSLSEIDDPDRAFPLKGADFSNVNPNTGTAPIFRNRRDASITAAVHARISVLVDRRSVPPKSVWPLRYTRMLDMANDSGLFRTREQLEKDGFYAVTRNRLKKGDLEYLPLYEGKMVQAYDHRAADIVLAKDNLFRPGQTDVLSEDEHKDPEFLPNPRYFVDRSACDWPAGLEWVLAFKDVTSVTNARTMISTVIPFCGAGHTLPVLFPAHDEVSKADDTIHKYVGYAPFICANLNSFVLDYLARQKVQGNHLTWFIVEQLPILPADSYHNRFGGKTAVELLLREILHLTYTANDMTPFARDLGYDGAPFVWDAEDRRHRRARLDALFFHLYGISREDAAYILDTFPIVKREDEAAFGRYLTKDLILAYMNAVAAGDIDTVVSV